MKKRVYLLVLIILAVWSTVSAEHPYRPFVKEGKIWRADYYNEVVEYIITGDTTINNVEYKRVYYKSFRNYQDSLRHYFGAVREADKVVTMVYAGQYDPYVLYDFNLLFNDQTTVLIPGGYRYISWKSTMDSPAGPFRFIQFVQQVNGLMATMKYIMTEGVGWETEPFETGPGGYFIWNLIGCYEDGRRIFKQNDHRCNWVTTFGDQNNDGKVDIADVNKLIGQRYMNDDNDINRDLQFTDDDIFDLIDYMIGIDITDR